MASALSSAITLTKLTVVVSILFSVANVLHYHGASFDTKRIEIQEATQILIDGQQREVQQLVSEIEQLKKDLGVSESRFRGEYKKLVDHDTKLQQLLEELQSQTTDNHQHWEELQSSLKKRLKNAEKSQKALLATNPPTSLSTSVAAPIPINVPIRTTSSVPAAGEPRQLKIHLWDDSFGDRYKPREVLLVTEGWFEYKGGNVLEGYPWFVPTADPAESDFIVWITTMARHELEVPPVHPIDHKHKVIVLDYADGCNLHEKRDWLRGNETLLGYFRRSFVSNDKDNKYKRNCTEEGEEDILPYTFSGSRAMMIPYDSKVTKSDYTVSLFWEGIGKIYSANKNDKPNAPITNGSLEDGNGYYQDSRFENFLVPFRDRKWTLTNVLKKNFDMYTHNTLRTTIIEWTEEFSRHKTNSTTIDDPNFVAYIGLVEKDCSGHCFGENYLRHLRDAKIVVTCNPSFYEGDYRQFESFLSGALVFIDEMTIPSWMPHPPVYGKHFVTYDPTNKTEFLEKLAYYSDPKNLDEAEAIAKAGYRFTLEHHMATNRVDYILDSLSGKLDKYVRDPSARATLGLPSRQAS